MAKYLVVARDGDKNVTAHFYQQLLDGIVASDMLFGQDGAAIVENHSPVVTQDRASNDLPDRLWPGLHRSKKDQTEA